MKKQTAAVLASILLLSALLPGCSTTNKQEIKSLYMSEQEWTSRYAVPEYFEIQTGRRKDRYTAFEKMVDNNSMMKFVPPWNSIFLHIDKAF